MVMKAAVQNDVAWHADAEFALEANFTKLILLGKSWSAGLCELGWLRYLGSYSALNGSCKLVTETVTAMVNP